MLVELRAGEDVHLRHHVVHERAGQELSALVVHDVLVEHLADALHDAAERLALEQHVVDHPPAVDHRHVVHDVDYAGIRIDLHFRDMRSAGKGHRRWNAVQRIELARVAPRDLLEGDGDIGSLHAVFAIGEFQIRRSDLQLFGGEFQALLHHRARRLHERAAMRHHRARAHRAAAGELRAARIARAQLDRFRRYAELLGHQLREHRLMTLP